MANFALGFDAASLAEIARLGNFEALLSPEITWAEEETVTWLVAHAQAKTWEVFANPTGKLAGSIYGYVATPEFVVAVGVPYGRRREYGFSGMTDALGRYYPYDPAKPYLQPTLDESEPAVLAFFEVATNRALGRLAV